MEILAYCFNKKFTYKYRVFRLERRGQWLVWSPCNVSREPPDLPKLPIDFHKRHCLPYEWETRYYKEGDLEAFK